MPDSIPAVGAQIQPPNPIQTFSNVLGLRQQQLAIQQQQAGVQTAQAEAAQANQKNQELTALHNFTMSAVNNPSYLNPDGTLNTQKFEQGAMSVAGTYGQAYIGQALTNANQSVQNRKSLLDLSNDQRKTIGGYLASVAADPNATSKSFLDAIENARGVSSDPSYQRSIDSMLMHLPNISQMNPAQQSQALRAYARNIAVATESPAASISGPSVTLTPGRMPLTTNVTQTNPLSPMGTGNVGQPVPVGIGTNIVTQPGTGAPNIVSGTGQASPIGGGQVPNRGQPNPNQVNWWNPAPGATQYLGDQVKLWNGQVTKAQSEAGQFYNNADALNRVVGLLQQPGLWTGAAFNKFATLKNLVAPLGIDTTNATNANELMKNIARYASTAATNVGDTDAARSLQEVGLPHTTMNKQAVEDVAQQSLASITANMYLANLQASAPGWQQARDRTVAFRQIPNLVATIELKQVYKTGGPTAANEFLKRNNFSGAQLRESTQKLNQLLQQLPQGTQ